MIHHKKINIWDVVVPVSAILFFFAVYVPLVAYVNNSQEFLQVRPCLLFGVSIGIFAVLMALLLPLFLLLKKTPRVLRYGLAFLCGLTIAFYVQGNLINLNYGILDGREIPWDKMVGAGIVNTLVWAVILLCFFAFAFFARMNFFSWLKMGMLCFLGYMSLILVMRCVTVKGNSVYPVQFTYEDFNKLSSTKNVIVLIIDSFEQRLFEQFIAEKPQYKDKLRDFTYYRNTIGKFPYTHYALPQILTGISDENLYSYSDYKDMAYLNSSILKIAQAHDYLVDIYAYNEFAPSGKIKNEYGKTLNNAIDCSTGVSYVINGIVMVYNSSFFSYLPHFAKRYHTKFYLPTINADEGVEYVQSSGHIEQRFFSLVKNHDFSLSSEKRLKFYHMVGVHLPEFNLKKAERCMRNMIDFLDILKKLNVYDNSLIFILADHGQIDRARPLFLCKNSSGKFTVSEKPFTYDLLSEAYTSAMTNNKARIGQRDNRVYYYNQQYGARGERQINYENAQNVYYGNDLTKLETKGIECENIDDRFWMWTNGGEAQIDIPLDKDKYGKDLLIKLSSSAMISDRYPRRNFEFSVNAMPFVGDIFDMSKKYKGICLYVPAKSNTNRYVNIKIRIENPIKAICVRPELRDHRSLGLWINRIEVEEAKMPISAKFNLSNVNLPEVTLATGFANPERPHGCWNCGRQSSIEFLIRSSNIGKNLEILFSGYPFLAGGKIPKQRMKVSSAGKLLLEKSFSKGGIESFSVRLPAEVTKKGQVTLDFEFPDCASPKELGMSADPRKLAVFFRTCEIKVVDDK